MLLPQVNRALDPPPRADRRLAQFERRGRAPNLAEIVDDRAALRALRDMPLHVRPLGRTERVVDVIVDRDIVRVHTTAGHARRPRSIRSFARALNTCDFEVPSAMPSRFATSL